MLSPPSADRRRFALFMPVLALVLLLADQGLKAWSLANLTPHGDPVPALGGLVEWYLTFNTGAAWSMFSGSALPLAIGRMLVGLGLLGWMIYRPQKSRKMAVALAAVAAGAIGNSIDGLRFGQVTDMIHMPLLSSITQALGMGSFPIFNVADICVVLGTLVLLALAFLEDGQQKKAKLPSSSLQE